MDEADVTDVGELSGFGSGFIYGYRMRTRSGLAYDEGTWTVDHDNFSNRRHVRFRYWGLSFVFEVSDAEQGGVYHEYISRGGDGWIYVRITSHGNRSHGEYFTYSVNYVHQWQPGVASRMEHASLQYGARVCYTRSHMPGVRRVRSAGDRVYRFGPWYQTLR